MKNTEAVLETSTEVGLEANSRLNLENGCYDSLQCFSSSRFLSKNTEFRIYKTITLPLVLYECETSSPTRMMNTD
jgi:hypothetical protein